MVCAWYMDDADTDQRLEHHQDPPQYCDLQELQKETNVLYWKIDPETEEGKDALQKIKKERGYTYDDLIEISREKLANYDVKLKSFYEEHLHTDEEIRFVIAGSGYFDVRNKAEKWIRIKVESGDLLVLPAGIYHRFTLDSKNYIKAMRLFIGEPVWTPYNRPADHMEERKKYVELQKLGF